MRERLPAVCLQQAAGNETTLLGLAEGGSAAGRFLELGAVTVSRADH